LAGAGYLWNSGKKIPRVGMRGKLQNAICGTKFDELPSAHDGDMRGELGDNRQAVRDKNVGELEFALEFLKKKEDLRADGNVQGGNRFVCDNEFGTQDKRAGDADTLALAAGKFVRIAVEGGFGETDAFQHFRSAPCALYGREFGFVDGQRFGDNFANAHPRIQRSERVLKNHLHLPALSAEVPAGKFQEVAAFEKNGTAVGLDEAKDHARESGFAAAAFTDNGEGFARGYVEADVIDSDEAIGIILVGECAAATDIAFA
jgi:hypothetical protein